MQCSMVNCSQQDVHPLDLLTLCRCLNWGWEGVPEWEYETQMGVTGQDIWLSEIKEWRVLFLHSFLLASSLVLLPYRNHSEQWIGWRMGEGGSSQIVKGEKKSEQEKNSILNNGGKRAFLWRATFLWWHFSEAFQVGVQLNSSYFRRLIT